MREANGLEEKTKQDKSYTICSPEIMMDLLIGDTGECVTEYGGVVIRVLDPARFPWEHVFRTLLKLNHEVYIDERDDFLVIISKPKVD
ncbi:MAG: hypothetical protein QXT51_03610 [Nitrososphaerota archaeon]